MKTIFHINLILIVSFLASCSKPSLAPSDSTKLSPVYTEGINYKRQNFIGIDLQPPYLQIDDESLKGHSTTTPCLIGDQLFITTRNGYLCQVDVLTLDETADKKISDGIQASPTFAHPFILIASEADHAGLSAYDITSGKIIWKTVKHHSTSSPVSAMDMVFHACYDGVIQAYNLLEGELIWEFDTGSKIAGSLIYDRSQLTALTQTGDIYKLDGSSGTVIWKKSTGNTFLSSPLLTNNGTLTITSYEGNLLFINDRTGVVIGQKVFDSPVYMPPSADDSLVYISVSNSKVTAITPENQGIKWETVLKGPASCPALVTNNHIIIGTTRNRLYLIDKNNGSITQEFILEGRLSSIPVVYNNRLIFGMEYAKISALIPKKDAGNEF
ncbi:MAG: PQQ-binding-like beta-propeller repeat protein [Calditrichaceae bacterium]|nr:PQQ-binding-like beta-propeller repeat protein [Calditrichaceae bacterium]MBN2709400.1 PQQ-binding-like beta-propeller repeat protein [Calditrichaceae bacterium]RQV94445.1 MAG: hypothetical protein EH224_10440 [Calditrichota bacterium]